MEIRIFKNKRVGEGGWVIGRECSLKEACENKPSIYLVDVCGIYICKSCLNHLEKMINNEMMEDIKNEH